MTSSLKPLSDLTITADLLDVPEGIFRFGTKTGFDFPSFQLLFIQRLSAARLIGDEPRNIFAVSTLIPPPNAKTPCTVENSLRFNVQQLSGRHQLLNVGSGGIGNNNGIHDAAFTQHGRQRIGRPTIPALRAIRATAFSSCCQAINLSILSKKISRRVLRFLVW